MLKIIACIDSKFGIGLGGKMPWPKLKADLRYFREQTSGCTVVMGRKTFESIEALPKRDIILYTGQLKEILDKGVKEDIWIIGGEQVYNEFIEYSEEIHLTRILNKVYGCDRFFPKFNPLPDWVCNPIGFYCESGIEFLIEQYTRISE